MGVGPTSGPPYIILLSSCIAQNRPHDTGAGPSASYPITRISNEHLYDRNQLETNK